MLRRYTSSGSTVEDKVPFFNCLTHKRGTYEFTQLRHYKRYLFQYSSNINIFNTFCVIYVTVTTYTILTYNFQILLLLYLILSVVVDILVSRNKSNDISENMQKLVNIRSIFFVCAVLPLGVITSLLFWPLFLYDPYFSHPQNHGFCIHSHTYQRALDQSSAHTFWITIWKTQVCGIYAGRCVLYRFLFDYFSRVCNIFFIFDYLNLDIWI